MAAGDQVYPLSTPDGKQIPYDLGEPTGLWITAFVAAASAEKTLPSGWEIVVLFANADCVVAFGEDVTLNLNVDEEKVNHQYVPAFTPISIKLPSLKFKTIRVSEDGTLYIQKYRKWQGLTNQAGVNTL